MSSTNDHHIIPGYLHLSTHVVTFTLIKLADILLARHLHWPASTEMLYLPLLITWSSHPFFFQLHIWDKKWKMGLEYFKPVCALAREIYTLKRSCWHQKTNSLNLSPSRLNGCWVWYPRCALSITSIFLMQAKLLFKAMEISLKGKHSQQYIFELSRLTVSDWCIFRNTFLFILEIVFSGAFLFSHMWGWLI